ADVFDQCYGMSTIGLRYFNVFGPRQDPQGAYAAVVPRWAAAMLHGDRITIYGDGETTRDFRYIANVVQAHLLAATPDDAAAARQIYNVAVGGPMALNELYAIVCELTLARNPEARVAPPIYEPFRAGDVRHSQADIDKAKRLLGYEPTHDVRSGLAESLARYDGRSAVAAPVARKEACVHGAE